MKAKKGVYCGLCHNKLTIAKKGKHKYYICPIHNIIAYNPIPLLATLAASVAPTIIEKGSELFSKKSTPRQEAASQIIKTDSLDKPNERERVINKVLYGGK